ncbi:hypothetical protein LG632_21565 [Streptomyces sp. SMC 277]|uniref:STAS domain-containing protein n=1 Tax=Streptomyces antimicrobicus TaxID=2883108 RepID=A0ABS8BBE8_9ACTN|nr:hypothetical protein [Streptomyces antimicrobicus]MCB5181955.1 hypothetical protein [Streptomyces antimicrobicus]
MTGPDRSRLQQTTSLEAAARGGRGVGVRVRVTGGWDAGTAEAVRSLLARAEPAVRADLLLDLGGVLADRPDAGKQALRALDALVPTPDLRRPHPAPPMTPGTPSGARTSRTGAAVVASACAVVPLGMPPEPRSVPGAV